ncbi:aldo/keto reductase [Glacieibacterium megasporae]|uniref:aldo/keto reductase n=1 Tax=Glacieibacterium megasporae TaxID=2835787 RepID=UPI001C1E66D9|nr:aldo/keto reductase [Polymorphobacter megasporae]UAJ11836.1 aldo/keto reductase [Polymorphobacter megasporae]
MAKRKLGPFMVESVGLGCMSLSYAYGTPPGDTEGEALLHRALDLGYDFLDTAALYGVGHNETLIGRALKSRRDEFILASKCGIRLGEGGIKAPRVLDGSRAGVTAVLDESLSRLGVDTIDLYYLHRLDPKTPIEESVGALADAVTAGKIRSIGLSEVSAATLRRAAAVHPIAALQTEYSLWTRNPELGVLAACHELGTTFVAFSPVARGFLAGGVTDPAALTDGDIRRTMPRFQGDNFAANNALFTAFAQMAADLGHTPAQLSLAWLINRDADLVTIPGTASVPHLEENWAARDIVLDPATMTALDALINQSTVHGHRYSPAMNAAIDTEDYPAAEAA